MLTWSKPPTLYPTPSLPGSVSALIPRPVFLCPFSRSLPDAVPGRDRPLAASGTVQVTCPFPRSQLPPPEWRRRADGEADIEGVMGDVGDELAVADAVADGATARSALL